MSKKSVPAESSISIPLTAFEHIKTAVQGCMTEMNRILETVKTSSMYQASTRLSFAMTQLVAAQEQAIQSPVASPKKRDRRKAKGGPKRPPYMTERSGKPLSQTAIVSEHVPAGFRTLRDQAEKVGVSCACLYERLRALMSNRPKLVKVGRNIYVHSSFNIVKSHAA